MKNFSILKCFSSIIMIMSFAISQDSLAQSHSTEKLNDMFYDYEVVNIASEALVETARNNHFFNLTIPKNTDGQLWNVELHDSRIIGDNYLSQFVDETGIHNGKKTTAKPTTGNIVGDLSTSVSLTFNEGFIYGFIKDKTGYNFIEPLEYYDSSQRGSNLFVVYNEKDIKPEAPHSCGSTEMHDKRGDLEKYSKETSDSRMVIDCYEVDYAIANDYLMFVDFGSVAAVENHAIGVTNNVQTNWDDEFEDELQFIIVTQFTPTTAASDPWTTSTDAGTLLDDFSDWGPGGFGITHDVGSLWTDRNFNGSTIGIAWLSVVCTSNRYNCLQNFTTNPNTKRVLVSHELGHNFAAGHDASGSNTIMAPSVNSSNTWSGNSINSIDNHVDSRWCLADCASGGAPPAASFDFTIIEECTPALVQFINTSTGSNLSYEWDFPGGTPSFSTLEDPFVTYDNPGSFNVTLTVTNGSGQDEEIQNGLIDIIASPNPTFSYAITGTIVSFFNISQNADTYFWDFGDGSTSNFTDPVHDYLDDGFYLVTLTATSACGSVSTEQIIEIANPPVADFNANVLQGCAPLVVQYTSNSSNNTDIFVWTFEGGTPSVSNQENPLVTYNEAGSFDATLTVINETGDDVLAYTDYINVQDEPIADFSYVINESEVTFTNFSVYPDTYLWDFGDGMSSTEENPVHTFADGTYTVILTVTNECGESSANTTIIISLAPVASFEVTNSAEGCAPLTVNFESTSTNEPDEYAWTFEGGSPATSNVANPSILYENAGIYNVTLMVTNDNGSNSVTMEDFVVIIPEPIAAFSFTQNGLETAFFDGSLDANNYAWDFGDGNSSTAQNPTYTYAAEGEYTVLLTVTNECGSHSETMIVNNYTPVQADFSSAISSGCSDLVVEFEDQSSSNVTNWMWTFEGGTPSMSTEQNPTVTYSIAGTYDVVLTVSHPQSSETTTLTNYISVQDVPVTTFSFFEDLYEVTFTNNSINGNSFEWDFGDGEMSTEVNPIHTYDEEGSFEVTLISTNECGSTTSSQSVSINALPNAGFNANTTAGCGPLTVQFSDASSSNVIEWEWSFEGGNPTTSDQENPEVIYNQPGTYSVVLVVTSVAGSDEITLVDYITVSGAPLANVDFSVEGNSIAATSLDPTATTNAWTVNGEEFDGINLDYVFPANGTYEVELIASNECGEDSETIVVSIDVYPEAQMTNLPIVLCEGDEVQMIDNSTNAESKLWVLEGGSPDMSVEDNPTITYSTAGTYSIVLEVNNQYGVSTETFEDAVIVMALPTATFEGIQSANMIDFTANAMNATSYHWDFGDGSTSTEENPQHTYTKNGEYEVTLTVTNECGEVVVMNTYFINSNAVTETELAAMMIYPNPTSTYFTIEVNNVESDDIHIQMMDVSGKVVFNDVFKTSIKQIDVSSILNGTYFIRMNSEAAVIYKKVVILR